MLCGPQYSGKSNFGRIVKGYKHYELDSNYDFLNIERRDIIMDILKQYLPTHCNAVNNIVKKRFGVMPDKARIWTKFEDLMIADGGSSVVFDIKKDCAMLYMGECLRDDKNVIVDGLFVNKLSREYIIDQLSISSKIDFSEVPKTVVYFNTPEKKCIKRHKKHFKKYGSCATKKDDIKDSFRVLEIPKEGEMPNLEVIVVSNNREIRKALKILQRKVI